MSGLASNVTLWSALLGWAVAQAGKQLTHLARHRRVDFRLFISAGGMPSSHAATVSALAASVALHEGMGGSLFAVTAVFALIVMFDAQSVRRAAGVQARLLNQIVDELFREHRLAQTKLVTLLGHTPLEVLAGMAIGILCAFTVHFYL